MRRGAGCSARGFLPTPSARRATRQRRHGRWAVPDFYPRPPRGGRPRTTSAPSAAGKFLPTPSARRATGLSFGFLSQVSISTHALREEGDGRLADGRVSGSDFYPRPPRGGRPLQPHRHPGGRGISTHALREEGDGPEFCVGALGRPISTHALREEGDPGKGRGPGGGAISTHALREEGDRLHGSALPAHCDFYPRPPRGGRHVMHSKVYAEYQFLPTPSARRATWPGC